MSNKKAKKKGKDPLQDHSNGNSGNENSEQENREQNAEDRHDEEQAKEKVDVEQIEDTDQLLLDQQERIAELEEKVEELKDANLRKTAELDNARKRMQRERIQIYEASRASAIEQFLAVNDDLQRTLKVMDQSGESGGSGIEDGVRMIAEKFEEVLKKYNVERIDQTGVPFDVDLHDAMIRQKPEDEDVESDIVLEVLENGYKMGDRTIRHAKVIVSE